MELRRRLMAIMLLTSGTVLAMTCAVFLIYDRVVFRNSVQRQLSTIAAIVADNSTAVLAFEDRRGAAEMLSALKAEHHIVGAALYDGAGRMFTTYPEGRTPADFPSRPGPDGYRFGHGSLQGFEPVVENGHRLGTLYVESDLGAISDRFRLYGLVAVAVGAIAFLLAYLLSRALQRRISDPITALADIARAVAERRDYSVRAVPSAGARELTLLTGAFNEMLTRIQEQLGRMELLSQITRAIGERLDLASIFRVMVGALEENLPLDLLCVLRYEPSQQRFTVDTIGARSAGTAKALSLAEGERIAVDAGGLDRGARGQFVYEPDAGALRAPFAGRLAAQGLRSLVLAPLIVDSGVFGLLLAARREPGAFGQVDREFLRLLSAHAALAAHQAQLYGALQQAYEDLRRSQQAVMDQERLRALGQMASGIAHDINNAISPAALYVEAILEREIALDPRSREQLQTIAHAIEDVSATVARMREYSRKREAKMSLVPVNLNRSLQQVIDLTRARWNDEPQQQGLVIQVRTEFDQGLPPVMAVEGEVREALTNLFLNAFDAMPQGGTLTLRTRSVGGMVQVEVSDTGTGMDEETRRRCLEPFYTTKGERGTGLGLAMVFGVAERHGADLEIESAVGKGTTFRLTFQAAAAAPSPAEQPGPAPMPAKLRILVVDDDPLVAKVLRDTLQADGHAVDTANGGQAGIEAFRAAQGGSSPYELILTDLGMPYVDGRKVAAAVKEASPSTPVVLLTGWGQTLEADGEKPPHVDRVMSKPPRLAELREAVASFSHAPAPFR